VKISKFNRERNCQLRLNWQCNRLRLRLHFIFGQFNRLRLLKKPLSIDDYDYSMCARMHLDILEGNSVTCLHKEQPLTSVVKLVDSEAINNVPTGDEELLQV